MHNNKVCLYIHDTIGCPTCYCRPSLIFNTVLYNICSGGSQLSHSISYGVLCLKTLNTAALVDSAVGVSILDVAQLQHKLTHT